ncbi:ABC transporter permease [Corynebacterium sp. AOP40-9SA-29]|uniref:ABC transporter permease n=1 Tax=Corynebacterium sp. AOP40-9SA-29 TaxID=3457677 RepID=UPI0040338161
MTSAHVMNSPTAAPFPRAVALHAGRTLRGWSRTPAILAQALGMPVAMLLIITFMFGTAIEMATDRAAVQGLVPLMICTGPMFAGTTSAAGLVTERQDGLFTRFRTLPGARVSPLVGRVAAEVVRGTVGAVLVLMTGLFLGYRVDGLPGVLGILALSALVALAISCLLTWVGMVARTPEATVAALPVMMIMMFCNSGFMPVEGFPSYMQGVVQVNPLSAVVEAMDVCAGTAAADGSVVPAVLWLLGAIAVGALLLTSAARRA